MSRIFQLTALFALVLWLPSSMHCALEDVAGWVFADCCTEERACDQPSDDGRAIDQCETVEDGAYRVAESSVDVAAPAMEICWCGGAVVAAPDSRGSRCALRDTGEAPPELRRSWQFLARAALPARAPSLPA